MTYRREFLPLATSIAEDGADQFTTVDGKVKDLEG